MIRELGFVYDSSLMADDEPYKMLADGEATGMVEIPVEWIRDDAPVLHDGPLREPAPLHATALGCCRSGRTSSTRRAREGGVFQLTLHPHIIGHRSRMVMLRELLDHIRATATSGSPPTPRSPTLSPAPIRPRTTGGPAMTHHGPDIGAAPCTPTRTG